MGPFLLWWFNLNPSMDSPIIKCGINYLFSLLESNGKWICFRLTYWQSSCVSKSEAVKIFDKIVIFGEDIISTVCISWCNQACEISKWKSRGWIGALKNWSIAYNIPIAQVWTIFWISACCLLAKTFMRHRDLCNIPQDVLSQDLVRSQWREIGVSVIVWFVSR